MLQGNNTTIQHLRISDMFDVRKLEISNFVTSYKYSFMNISVLMCPICRMGHHLLRDGFKDSLLKHPFD